MANRKPLAPAAALSARLAVGGGGADLEEMAIKIADTEWRDLILVCKKCSKKLDGGFGPEGDRTLKKALRKYLHLPKGKKGRKAPLAVIETGCFDICPKNAVVAINAAHPKALLIVPAGADLFEVKARLGLDDGRRLQPTFSVVGGE